MAEPRPARALTVLLRALAGRPGQVQWMPAPGPQPPPGPPGRPVLDDAHLLLPAALPPALGPAAVAHAAAHWLFSVPHQPVGQLTPIGRIVISSIEDARVEHLLAARLPGAARWFRAGLSGHRAEGLGFADLLARMSRALWEPDWIDPNPWVHKARDSVHRVVQAHGWQDAAALRRVAAVLANDLGQMRVRLDLASFAEPTPYRDDHSWLWQNPATRSDEQPLEGGPAPPPRDARPGDRPAPAPQQQQWRYPEWDHRTHHLRADWCTVVEHSSLASPADGRTAPLAPPLCLPAARPARRRLRRLATGDTLDLEACVRFAVERRQGAVPEPRLFQRSSHHTRTAAVLVLLDLSASTGDPLPGGASLLALEQQAAVLLARAYSGGRRQLALHGFSSDTRHAVGYWRLLDFGEPASEAERRLQAVAPRHSTRLGAALRHAAALLARQAADQRLLLVLTDGAPADIDVADPRYLVEDARHAVIGARRSGVDVACLATDPGAEAAIARVFGRRFARVARHPGHLPAQLLALHAQLAR